MKVKGSLLSLIAIAFVIITGWGTRSMAKDVPRLAQDNGPFLVNACSFRDPEPEVIVKAVVTELRDVHHLEAYLYIKETPGKTPEAIVLVGDAKSYQECSLLMQRVQRIKIQCLAGLPSTRTALKRAVPTTNPLAWAEARGRQGLP